MSRSHPNNLSNAPNTTPANQMAVLTTSDLASMQIIEPRKDTTDTHELHLIPLGVPIKYKHLKGLFACPLVTHFNLEVGVPLGSRRKDPLSQVNWQRNRNEIKILNFLGFRKLSQSGLWLVCFFNCSACISPVSNLEVAKF